RLLREVHPAPPLREPATLRATESPPAVPPVARPASHCNTNPGGVKTVCLRNSPAVWRRVRQGERRDPRRSPRPTYWPGSPFLLPPPRRPAVLASPFQRRREVGAVCVAAPVLP